LARNSQERLIEVARDVARDAPQLARDGQGRLIEVARDVARDAPQRALELRRALEDLDVRWARSLPARWLRENFIQFVLTPVLDHYAARRATGHEALSSIQAPVILIANHASHMDTPVILSSLPRRLRKRTAVAAAADYFYRNRLVASMVSLLFNTVPVDRKGSGGTKNMAYLDHLLDDGWNLLLYPEGSRKHDGSLTRVRRGAAVLAAAHKLPIVPIRVSGTAEAMPPGSLWPKRLRRHLRSRRHRIDISFGEPIQPLGDTAELVAKVQAFFDSGQATTATRSPYRRRGKRESQD
ncbi:MAG: lysophospholipid acyltransferase family protein, partial [Solirubrobacteraceae bacterium]